MRRRSNKRKTLSTRTHAPYKLNLRNTCPIASFKRFVVYSAQSGDIAHLVERLVRNQQVVGSSPIISKQHRFRCFFYLGSISSFEKTRNFPTLSGSNKKTFEISIVCAQTRFRFERKARLRLSGWNIVESPALFSCYFRNSTFDLFN